MGLSNIKNIDGVQQYQVFISLPAIKEGLDDGTIDSYIQVFLHELVHVATQRAELLGSPRGKTFFRGKLKGDPAAIQQYKDFYRELAEIHDAVVLQLNPAKLAGLDPKLRQKLVDLNIKANPQELLTYGLTDKTIARWLDTIPYNSKIIDGPSIYDKFISAIRKFFGIPTETASDTVLTNVLNIADRFLDPASTQQEINAISAKQSLGIKDAASINKSLSRIINLDPVISVSDNVRTSLLSGNLKQAMERLTETVSNNRLKEITRALTNVVGTTKVEVVDNLFADNGEKVNGFFDPKTNTIKLDSETGLNEHALLHEMTHAVVSASLANKGKPSTAKLNTLYKEVKDKLSGIYEIDTLDEFVSEVFSNPRLIQELGTILVKDSDRTALQRLQDILGNFVRSIIQGAKVKPTADVGTLEALSELDSEILNILAIAPEYRDAGQLHMAAKNGTANKMANKIGKVLHEGGKARNNQPVGQVVNATADFFASNTPRWFRQAVSKTMPSGSLAEFLKLQYKTDVGEKVANAVQEAVSATGKVIKSLDATKQSIGGWLADHPELGKTFDFVVHASTLFRVDPTKPREYYSQYFLLDTQTNKRTGFNSRKERDDEVFRLNDLYEKIAKQKGKDKPKKKIVKSDGNPDENTLFAYDRVVKEFNKLKAQGGDKAYIELRNTYRQLFEDLEAAMNDLTDNLTTEKGADVANAVKMNLKQTVLKQLFATAKIDPYFPLTRTGNYWLRFDIEGMPDPVVQSFTSDNARQRALVEYGKDDKIKNISTHNGADSLTDSFVSNAPTAGFVGQAMQILKDGGVDVKLQKQFLQLYINALPESSALKALKSRKDVLGFNTSAMDAFEQTAYNMGRQVVSVKESKNLYNVLRESLEKIKEIDVRSRDIDTKLIEANRRGDTAAVERLEKEKEQGYFNKDEAQILGERLQDDVEFITKPPSGPLEDGPAFFNRLTFLYTLGFNISSVIVNTGNLAVMVLFYLAGKTGIGTRGSVRAMSTGSKLFLGSGTEHKVRTYTGDKAVDVKATKVIGNSIDNYYETDDNGNFVLRKDIAGLDEPFYKMKNKDGSFKTMTKKEFLEMIMPLVQQAEDFGMLNRSMFADTFNASETLIKEGESNPMNNFNLNSVTGISALPFHTAERYARQTTLVASFLTEMERMTNNPSEAKGETKFSPSEKINAAIQQAMYDTSRTNGGHVIATAPPLARRNIFRSALMFKTFGIQMLLTQLMTTMEIFRGADSAAKKQAFKQIMGIQGATLLFAGVAGNTLFGWAAMFYNAFRDEDEDEDLETLTRKAVGEIAFKGGIYGLSQALPFMGGGIDVSDRIGLANMVIGNGKYNFNDTWEADFMALILGPTYGTFDSITRGYGQIAEGNISRGIEDMSPTALRNVIRAGRYGLEGARSRRGDLVLDDSSFSSGELVAQLFGFMPAEYSKIMSLRAVGKEMDKATTSRKSKISSQLYYNLRFNLDISGVLKDIEEFNRAHPADAIDAEYLERSLKAQANTTAKMINGVTISPSRRRMVQDLIDDTSLYPLGFR